MITHAPVSRLNLHVGEGFDLSVDSAHTEMGPVAIELNGTLEQTICPGSSKQIFEPEHATTSLRSRPRPIYAVSAGAARAHAAGLCPGTVPTSRRRTIEPLTVVNGLTKYRPGANSRNPIQHLRWYPGNTRR